MEYKGYHINAQVTIDESWDFIEKQDGMVRVATITGRTHFVDAHTKIDSFSIQDPEGAYLDIRTPSPTSAKACIDEHIRKNDEQLVSDCHHAVVERHKPERVDWYYTCAVCGDPCDHEEKANDK